MTIIAGGTVSSIWKTTQFSKSSFPILEKFCRFSSTSFLRGYIEDTEVHNLIISTGAGGDRILQNLKPPLGKTNSLPN